MKALQVLALFVSLFAFSSTAFAQTPPTPDPLDAYAYNPVAIALSVATAASAITAAAGAVTAAGEMTLTIAGLAATASPTTLMIAGLGLGAVYFVGTDALTSLFESASQAANSFQRFRGQ